MRRWTSSARLSLSLFAVLAGAPSCTGYIDAGGPTGSGPSNGPQRPTTTSGPPGVAVVADATAGESPLRRLGKGELHNTVLDLFPSLPPNFDADIDLPADNDVQLAFSVPGTVSDLEVKRFIDLAEATLAN